MDDWTRFRAISRLERKYDETLTEYLRAFCAMCKKACGRKLTEEEEVAQAMVEPISEERAPAVWNDWNSSARSARKCCLTRSWKRGSSCASRRWTCLIGGSAANTIAIS